MQWVIVAHETPEFELGRMYAPEQALLRLAPRLARQPESKPQKVHPKGTPERDRLRAMDQGCILWNVYMARASGPNPERFIRRAGRGGTTWHQIEESPIFALAS